MAHTLQVPEDEGLTRPRGHPLKRPGNMLQRLHGRQQGFRRGGLFQMFDVLTEFFQIGPLQLIPATAVNQKTPSDGRQKCPWLTRRHVSTCTEQTDESFVGHVCCIVRAVQPPSQPSQQPAVMPLVQGIKTFGIGGRRGFHQDQTQIGIILF
ncbi:hypothetical protein D3C84_820830 [compost metagenome]